ncbi:hypothetical protein EDC01DRAFT_138336 [Geopyxis carbonaria]|nr:hypothetical protein EDC01DRAFT_138336 [Geopyxis carbonaria]
MLDAKRDEKRRNRLLDWLSRVEYEGYHTNACQRRHTATCEWILQRPEFIKWRNPRTSSILWIHGNPGTGKTVAMSKIIDDLKSEDSSDTPVTYFYCNFDEKQNKDHIGSVVLASILKQILSKRPSLTHSSSIHKEYKRQKNHSIKLRMGERPYKEVQSLLFSEVGKLAGLYILIDGLDELGSAGSASSTSSRPRSDILSTILELVAMRSSTVKVIVSSRVAVEISHHLESFPQICVDQACTQTDMEMYIRATIEESVGRGGRLKRPLENNPELADQIVQKLTVKADGMFLYVHLQVKTLPMESTSRAVKQSVERVPVGMDNMYQEIFERLANDTEASQVLAMRTLSWVSCAARPLSVKEFIEVTAINPRERRLDPELREHDEKAILDVCSNLLIVVKHENEPVFRFCHFSVQEFLKQRMNKKNSGEISVAAIDMKATHQEIFDYSMIYLLRKEFDRGPWDANTLYECQDQFNKFMGSNPFTSYAAVYWPRHLLKMSDSAKQETIPTAIAFLKDTQRCRLCFQIYWFLTFRNDYPKDTTAIHIAGFFGLTDISRILLRDASVEEVNAQDSLGRSGLHWAAMNGHAATMRVFLEAGATVNILDERRMNPMGLAAFMGQKKIVDELLEYEKDRLDKEQLGISLLLATEGGRVDIVETLLGAGTDPTLMVHEMTDPLFLAASSRNIEICKLLLDSGAPVDTRREYGNPLQGAAANGCVDAVKLFLAKGAEIDWIGGEGATAMTSASFTGQYECVKVLLEHGATIRLQNDVLGGALNLAESTMNQAITDLILQHARKNNVPETLLRPPTISKKDHANKPTSGVSLDAMKMAAKGFFRVIRVKQMEIARGMLKLGGQMIISGVECDDLDFIDRYYELIIFMTPQMLPHKNSEMIEMLFSFLNMFYDLAQKSNYKDKIVKDYRAALSTIMGILLNGGFQTMILGLMINREKEIIKLIEKEKFLETESHLSFWRELMLVGMAVPGHCFITRGSSYVYVAIIGRLNEMPLGKDLGFKLMERDRLAVSEKHLAGLSVREGGNELVKLVEMYNAAYTLRLDEVVGVLSATAKSIEGSMGDLNINTQIAARVSGVRRGCTVEEWKWDHDEVPWWEKSTN